MRLAEYLAQAGETPDTFAKKLRVSRYTVVRYLNHERTPGERHMERIFRLSGGLVRPDDFYDVERWAKQAQRRAETQVAR